MDFIFDLNKISAFVLFFIPGFISSKIWCLIIPSENNKASDYILETISYSCLNFAALYWLINIINKPEFSTSHPYLFQLLVFLILFVIPILWPILLSFVLKLDCLRGLFLHPSPKSWDDFFSKGEVCYVLVHLKSGSLIGGLYSSSSFASSYPCVEDLYLEEVWKVSPEGKFSEKINSTKGLWISKDYFDYIEFFEPNKREVSKDEKEC